MESEPPPPPPHTPPPPPYHPREPRTPQIPITPFNPNTCGRPKPVGDFLIVRSIYVPTAADPAKFVDPVTLMMEKIAEIKTKEPPAASIRLDVRPASRADTTSVYVRLHAGHAPVPPDTEPRIDLLQMWHDALTAYAPNGKPPHNIDPAVSNRSLNVYHARQIEVESAYEIAVAGFYLNQDSRAAEDCDGWFASFQRDGQSLLVETRSNPQERDFCFYTMRDWATTEKLLFTLNTSAPTVLMSTDPDALVITSGSAQNANPHLPDDLMQTTIVMTEATDDSYIFARTLASLRRSTLAMERFQYAYGWLTQWAKSMAYVLEPKSDHPDTVDFDSIGPMGVNPLNVTIHNVKLIKDELDFLRAKVDDPQARYEELKHFIDDFTLPRFLRRAPITLLRKISRRRRSRQADQGEIHLELGMPFMPNSDILTLPVDLHGLDFPSIAGINDGIAIDGLHRDLNHPIPSYQILARITLADWTCTINNCVNPIDTDGLTRDFTRHANRIPHGWIIAQKAMSESKPKLWLKRTDLRGILNGDVSLSHVLNTFSNYSPTASCPNGHALKSLRSKGIRRLRDMGDWRLQFNGVWLVDVKAPPPTLPAWSATAKANWDKLTTSTPRRILHPPNGHDQPTRPLAHGTNTSTFLGVGRFHDPRNRKRIRPKSVTAALTGPKTLVLKLEGRNVSILHGELVGLIMCLIISDPNDADASLYSDHLNAVRLIEDSKTAVDQQTRLCGMNGRSYYRWILRLIADNPLKIIYTPGHASEVSVPAQMNREADHYASSAQRHLRDSNIRTYIDKSQIVEASKRIAVGHQQRMALHLYDTKAPPEYSYTTAYSAYSTVVQLYTRSGQLPTADLLYSRGKAHDPRCRMGCNAIEDQHHIFVECEQYTEWRSKAAEDVHRRTESKLKEKGYEETDAVDLLSTAKFLFSDKPHIWPLQYCT
ncbi:hypothetical protein B0H17DRAFT_1214425 [Mycena rosella]|uniref:Uncharacterized protein n=1 Tax=Mycena rosella TaxID=1033263 RepID=A0AAD7CQH5_MYCRO|nr:hypothetical protein B0H17DRAFT_1214425 [Mycena rosella]